MPKMTVDGIEYNTEDLFDLASSVSFSAISRSTNGKVTERNCCLSDGQSRIF